MRSHEPPYRLGEGVRVAVGSPYGCEYGDEVEPGAFWDADRHTVFQSLQSSHFAGCAWSWALRGSRFTGIIVALQYRAESLTHIAVMTKRCRRRGFPGRPAMAVHRTGAARAGGRLGRRRIRGRDQRGTRRRCGARSTRPAAAQGEGSAVHGVSRRGDDVVGRRHRRRACRGRRAACIRSACVATPRMTRRACATRSPATRAPANCTIYDPDTGEDRLLKRATVLGRISIRATTWNAGCGSPRATANASPSRLVWRQ